MYMKVIMFSLFTTFAQDKITQDKITRDKITRDKITFYLEI